MNSLLEMGQRLVGTTGALTEGTLASVRDLVGRSLAITAGGLKGLADAPGLDQTRLATKLRGSARAVRRAEKRATGALRRARRSTRDTFRVALRSLEIADQAARRALYENIPVSSIVGESFAGVVTTSTIRPAFRLGGRDVPAAEMAAAAQRSGLPRLVLCLPGIFNDEGIWEDRASSLPIGPWLRQLGSFPIGVRFNPGAHFSDSGRGLLTLMEDFLSQPAMAGRSVDVLTYSQGGLILRAALLQAKQAQAPFPRRLRRAVLVSSPDGGSYWEKLGFWVGRALEVTPIPAVRLAGFVGNQRSPAIKDLSHGIIREEDWQNPDRLKRYKGPRYFGELDDVDAYQIYSLVAERDEGVAAWFGDGMVERPSLTLLSDAVYRRKPNPKRRVTCLLGVSHFKILQAEGLGPILREILSAD